MKLNHLRKDCAFCCFLLHIIYHNARRKKRKPINWSYCIRSVCNSACIAPGNVQSSH